MIMKNKNDPLYVHRPLLNHEDVTKWAEQEGIPNITNGKDMHVIIAFSKFPVKWNTFTPRTGNYFNEADQGRSITKFGDKNEIIVLKFTSHILEKRWKEFKTGGCSWDFPGYIPHISISYDGLDIDLTNIKPFAGKLLFGPEIFEDLDLNWKAKIKK